MGLAKIFVRAAICGMTIIFLMSCAGTRNYYHPKVRSLTDEDRLYDIDNAKCLQVAHGSASMPDIMYVQSPERIKYDSSGSADIMEVQTGRMYHVAYRPAPAYTGMTAGQAISQGVSSGIMMAGLFAVRQAQDEIHCGCMRSLGWEKGEKPPKVKSMQLFWEGFNALDDVEYAQSIKIADEAIALDENNAKAYYLKSLAHERKGDYEESVKSSNRSIELTDKRDTEFLNLYYQRKSSACFMADQFDAAIDAAKKATELNPDDAWSHFCLLRGYVEIGTWNQIENERKAIMRLDPETHERAMRTMAKRVSLRALSGDFGPEVKEYFERK